MANADTADRQDIEVEIAYEIDPGTYDKLYALAQNLPQRRSATDPHRGDILQEAGLNADGTPRFGIQIVGTSPHMANGLYILRSRLHSVYYDTPDQQLRAAGATLCVRHAAPGKDGAGGATQKIIYKRKLNQQSSITGKPQRFEREESFPGIAHWQFSLPDICGMVRQLCAGRAGDNGEARRQLAALCAQDCQNIQPLFIQRHNNLIIDVEMDIILEPGSPPVRVTIELNLDDAHYYHGDENLDEIYAHRADPFLRRMEFEVEVKKIEGLPPMTDAQYLQLCEQIVAQVGHSLFRKIGVPTPQPGTLSKAEHGFRALAASARRPAGGTPRAQATGAAAYFG